MPPTLTPDEIGAMTAGELIERIHTLPMADLAALTRDTVDAMPESARQARRYRLNGDPTQWGLDEIAAAAGVTGATVARWRNNYLAGKTGESSLLKPFNEDTADVKRPGEQGRSRSIDRPKWRAGDVRRWLTLTERVNVDLFPQAKYSPGRPRKPR